MLRGAITARMRWDLPLAERLARFAHENGGGFEAGLLVGQVQWLGGRSADAEATFAGLGDAASASERTMLATLRMDNLVLGLNRSDEAVRVGEEAEARVRDPSLRGEIVARRTYALIMSGRTGAANALIEPLLPAAQGRTLAAVALSAAHGFALAGRSNAAIEATERGLAAHRALAALDAVSARFETMGADLYAAEAAAQAEAAWRRAGDSRRATAAGRRAAALAGRCEGAVTPALSTVGSRVMLSPGEHDVARLAAAGRSNPEIAAQLHLSRRTVENYLYRVYEKLGISGRADLAAALQGDIGATGE
jgi:DNA-binding CsgD family transcriptional regulator